MTGLGKPTDPGQIDLRGVLFDLWAGRKWILGTMLFFTVVLGSYAFLAEPRYRATVVMVAANTQSGGVGGLGAALGRLGGLAALAGVNVGGGDTQTQEALAVVESREFTERFIRERNLLPVLFADKWDAANLRWKGEAPTIVQGFRKLRDLRTVSSDEESGLMRLELLWSDPTMAADWANDMVARVNAEMRERAIARTSRSLGYLEKELSTTSTIETREAISRLVESQINERMLANVSLEYAFRVVDRALPADPRDVASPNKPLLIVLGPVIGLILGAVLAFLIAAVRTPPDSGHRVG